MDTKELNENWNGKSLNFSQKPVNLNDNEVLMNEENRYEMFRKIRIRLGKTKEEFRSIFELYYHLRNK
jgi:hypothetical protein